VVERLHHEAAESTLEQSAQRPRLSLSEGLSWGSSRFRPSRHRDMTEAAVPIGFSAVQPGPPCRILAAHQHTSVELACFGHSCSHPRGAARRRQSGSRASSIEARNCQTPPAKWWPSTPETIRSSRSACALLFDRQLCRTRNDALESCDHFLHDLRI
jgi:hypothetical protein